MLKTPSLTAGILLTLLGFLNACAPNNPPAATSPTPEPEASQLSLHETERATQPDLPIIAPMETSDEMATATIEQYLKKLSNQGFFQENQGVWIQSGNLLLANHQGTVPLPAASITKIATSLVTLEKYGPDHQFFTTVGVTGTIENGVLQGDLVIEGGSDPFFVWEDAIALGNLLNQKGIQRVTGNLIIVGNFYMNFESNPRMAGDFLQEGLNAESWSIEAQNQYSTLPPGTPQPKVRINGTIQVLNSPPDNLRPIIRHASFPVAELIKKMNQYSNNLMADMLADSAGGAKFVAQKAAELAGVPAEEIQLVNGSGLSEENRISPRAAVAMFLALERYLQPYNLTVGDVVTIIGQDAGILSERSLPNFAVVKSGTLDRVSALGGALPTQKQGIIWFAIMNGGENVDTLRAEQETLLKTFLNQWQAVNSIPEELKPNPERKNKTSSNQALN